jgi:hypothetical protein
VLSRAIRASVARSTRIERVFIMPS